MASNEINEIKETTPEIVDVLAREGLKKIQTSGKELSEQLKKIVAENAELRTKNEAIELQLATFLDAHQEITQSPEQEKIFEALARCLTELYSADLERTGKGNRGAYATLPDLTYFAMPIIGKHGLSFRSEPIVINDKDYLRTTLGHNSGQWTSSISRIIIDHQGGKDVNQSFGSALTYAKKYAFGACFMLHTGGEKE